MAGIALGAAQPSFPSPPSDAPSLDFPVPSAGPAPSRGGVPTVNPVPPTGTDKPTHPPGVPQPPLPRSVNVQLKVERDGRLTVREQVIVQARQTMTRTAPLRIGDRVFTVRDPRVEGNGTAAVEGDSLVLRLGEGASTVDYTVDGTVEDLGDRLRFRWQIASGWDTVLVSVRASLLTPQRGSDFACLAGPAGTEDKCDSALTDGGAVLRVVQSNLDQGARVDLSADLPAGSVPATARFEAASAASAASAFALSPLNGVGLGAGFLLLLAGFAVLWRARARDGRALGGEVEPVALLDDRGGEVVFASPDGILPGQVGAVVDERVDARDLSATVVDLAVRNYLWVTEVDGDWQVVRRNPADDALTAYEKAVYTALLPEGVESVRLSRLRAEPPSIAPARDAVYRDAVSRGWFTRRPSAFGPLGIAGAVLLVLGVGGTVLFAVLGGPALIGVAVAIVGLAVLAGGRLLPLRTERGSVLLQQVRGVQGFLNTADPGSVPAAQREMVFSRALPYAVALDDVEQWLQRFGGLDPAADGTPGLYWYATQDPAAAGDQQRFGQQFRAFLDGLDEVFATA
ncbi:hypothetical protein BJP25_04195 [Actinokineospora bangkokensis]|uniref:Predicted membrane protein YciQ-like C-terminal domain-containing protein n=1 Tax=Actinokineospora bangkokensis TaxID=1193682 RepID=A0A1Q9LDR1_9PSEU|nr:hypothetical protein BJP25_04195 [Actinokineospora bangkokensis]